MKNWQDMAVFGFANFPYGEFDSLPCPYPLEGK